MELRDETCAGQISLPVFGSKLAWLRLETICFMDDTEPFLHTISQLSVIQGHRKVSSMTSWHRGVVKFTTHILKLPPTKNWRGILIDLCE